MRIFTARAASPAQRANIARWLDTNGIGGLVITNQKDGDMAELWDDLAVRVLANSGKVCPECAKAARFRATVHPITLVVQTDC